MGRERRMKEKGRSKKEKEGRGKEKRRIGKAPGEESR